MDSDSPRSHVKVTVGMCVKNCEDTIKEAIESVLDQEFPNELMKLIIVDGRSHDRTLEIIRDSLKKSSIQVKIFYESEGLGRARQIVVDNASGEYIVWVDGDMVLSKDFVKKQVEFMDRNPHVGVAKGKYGILKRINKNMVAFLEDAEFTLNTLFEGEVSGKVLATSGSIYRVKAIKHVGSFDPHFKGVAEDMDVENKLRDYNWKLYINSAYFYEIRRQNWHELWNEYFWHGQGAYRFFRKNRRSVNLHTLFPPVALVRELFRVPFAYRLTHRKVVLFLPVHYVFKRIAWTAGYVKASIQKGKI